MTQEMLIYMANLNHLKYHSLNPRVEFHIYLQTHYHLVLHYFEIYFVLKIVIFLFDISIYLFLKIADKL